MTRAPAALLAARSLLLTHLDAAPGPDDLEPAEVGIVGDPDHRGGYHCGSDRVVTGDYSVVESPRDRAGLTLDAAALDVGEFAVTAGGRTYDLAHFSAWCVGQCRAGAADARDIREIIWSPDGRTVRRWDALGIRSTGDDSHRWHTHFSFFRDAIKAGRDQRPLFRRYLSSIGLLEDDMPLTDADVRKQWTWDLKDGDGTDAAYKVLNRAAADAAAAKAEAIKARLTGEAVLAAVKGVDDEGIKALITQLADAERQRDEAAAARDAELAELVRQGQSGELDAAEVVRLIGEKLAAESTAT